MRKISRRDFLSDSSILLGTAFLFRNRKKAILEEEQSADEYPSYINLAKRGKLSERVEKLYSIYENCRLCPRDCRVNRKEGQTGKCRSISKVKVSSAFPHFGEEAPLVGKKGSGTVFFSNCGLRCVYCQNYKISHEGEGVEVTDERLAEMMVKVQELGCHNINLVTPTHYLPNIVNALQKAIPLGLRLPLVYNTSGYEKLETLQLLDGIIDIYLPDCKYTDPEQSAKYSDGAYNYPYYAFIALKEMFRQVGDLMVNKKGIAVKGLIIRHLILPNQIAGTEKFLKFVAEELSKTTYLNIMSQYRPEYKAFEYREISRRIKQSEFEEAIRWARKYGLNRLDRY